jgi:hypothetical protein
LCELQRWPDVSLIVSQYLHESVLTIHQAMSARLAGAIAPELAARAASMSRVLPPISTSPAGRQAPALQKNVNATIFLAISSQRAAVGVLLQINIPYTSYYRSVFCVKLLVAKYWRVAMF